MKVTLIGRPGQVIEKEGYYTTTIKDSKAPPLPKGLPTPPETPLTYLVYIAPKQWRKVAEALKNPDDVLIVEGWATYDPALKRMAVWAQNATTKLIQQAQRAIQQG